MSNGKEVYFWAVLRISLGIILLWASFDKVFGLGFATASDNSWLSGVSPTYGFLKAAVKGPFASFYSSIAGSAIVDWLFMVGLGAIGLCLILGIGLRIAGWSGTLMMLLMWSARLPPDNNPIFDEHIIYAIIFVAIAVLRVGSPLGFGDKWRRLGMVRKYRILE